MIASLYNSSSREPLLARWNITEADSFLLLNNKCLVMGLCSLSITVRAGRLCHLLHSPTPPLCSNYNRIFNNCQLLVRLDTSILHQ